MGRTRIVAAAIVVALLIAAYGAWWLHAAGRLHEAIGSWAEAQRARGWQIELEDVSVRGFPLRLQAEARHFSVGRDLPVRWRWAGPPLTASIPPWGGRVVTVSFPGAHEIEFDAREGRNVIAAVADTAGGTVQLADDGRIALATVALGRTRAELPGLGEAKLAKLDLSVGTPVPPAATASSDPRAPEVARLSFAAERVELPERAATALGPIIGRAELTAMLRGAVPTAHTEAALQAWRDAGGTVEVEKLRLHWGEFQVEAEGTLALDAALQPQGALTARAWDIGAAIDALVAAGNVRPREGATAKVVLRTMEKPRGAEPGVPPEIELPLALQERTLFLGPIPLGRIPVVSWP